MVTTSPAGRLRNERNRPSKVHSQRPVADTGLRAAALHRRKIEFIPNEKFANTSPDESPLSELALVSKSADVSTLTRPTREVATPLALACAMPLLTTAEERGLFERMNHLKSHAATLREWLPSRPSAESVAEIESLLDEAERIRNRIVGANVRLVVSLAKKFAGPQNPLDELVSDGILSMMHAVEKFDYDRGFRFSTYATRAIQRNLYRYMAHRKTERTRFATATGDSLVETADDRHTGTMSEQRWAELQSQLKRMLHQLEPREQHIVRARFGLEKTGEIQTLQALARSMGVCKERVRQIEKRALGKLQKMVREVKLEEPIE